MDLDEYTEYIEKKLHEKGINIETQDYVIKYIYLNQKLFGRTLNIDKVINRIVDNLNHSIISIDIKRHPLKEMLRIATTAGSWEIYDNKISINPINKLCALLIDRKRQENESTVMHEIDHCATTEYVNLSEEEKERYIQMYLERNKIKSPKIINKVKEKINKMYKEYNGILAISGILDYREVIKNGINLRKLNEGITSYKQEMYDKFLGNKPHTGYEVEKSVAKFIGDMIGKEELIRMHFENDYEGIRTVFKQKTGKELNELVDKLNEKSEIKTMFLGKKYIKRFKKKIEKEMKEYRMRDKGSTEFIPRACIDYEAIGNKMNKNRLQNLQSINSEIEK